MSLTREVYSAVSYHGDTVSTSSYLGHIYIREGGLNQICSMSNWRLSQSEYLPPELCDERMYLPAEFDEVVSEMMQKPLRRENMVDNPAANLRFLQCEALGWLGINPAEDFRYTEMWDGAKNVSDYRAVASSMVQQLVSKVPSMVSQELSSDSRSFELRFPQDYCPISWGFYIDNGKELRPYLIFRSVEVSRNLLNDLYLFMVYFGYIFGKGVRKESPPFALPVSSIHFFAIDAHIVDFHHTRE